MLHSCPHGRLLHYKSYITGRVCAVATKLNGTILESFGPDIVHRFDHLGHVLPNGMKQGGVKLKNSLEGFVLNTMYDKSNVLV